MLPFSTLPSSIIQNWKYALRERLGIERCKLNLLHKAIFTILHKCRYLIGNKRDAASIKINMCPLIKDQIQKQGCIIITWTTRSFSFQGFNSHVLPVFRNLGLLRLLKTLDTHNRTKFYLKSFFFPTRSVHCCLKKIFSLFVTTLH